MQRSGYTILTDAPTDQAVLLAFDARKPAVSRVKQVEMEGPMRYTIDGSQVSRYRLVPVAP